MDMNDTIVPKSDQMNAEDLLSGPRTFTITEVRISDAEQPVWIYLAEHPQPWKPAKTVRKLLVLGWGPDQTTYIGRRVTLFNDETIKWAGKPVGGIRMSHMSHIKKKITANLSETKGRRAPHVVEPLTDVAPAKAPGPLDQLVWAMNAAKIGKDDRLDYCRNIVQHELGSAADLTPDEMATVVESLQEAIAYEREQGNQDG